LDGRIIDLNILIMRIYLLHLMLMITFTPTAAQDESAQLEYNKKIAKDFYEDLWFNNNTANYSKYVAEEYIVHDIGDRKNNVEPGEEQKGIADFFWSNGNMTGKIDYQIAQDDLVATRWTWSYEPSTLFGKFVLGDADIPIINVFRIRNGKIVEIWNHRHDIDTSQTNIFVLKGLAMGIVIALIPFIWALRLRRKLKNSSPFGGGAGGGAHHGHVNYP
jgi:predicted SnoaL-like aldol condensation-catalyzing enzyme